MKEKMDMEDVKKISTYVLTWFSAIVCATGDYPLATYLLLAALWVDSK